MAKAPQRPPPQDQAQIDAEVNEGGPPDTRTPLERMTDLTRRIVHVPKSEIAKPKTKKGRHH
jgi:hypothetical protein